MTIGIAPSNAKAAPVVKLSAPGPSVARHTPGRPVNRPCVAAMKAAACSCRVTTSLMVDRRSDSTTSRFSSPGTPKIRSTPSFSKARTSRSEPFMLCPHRADTFGEDYVAEEHGTDIQETDYKNHFSQPVAVSSLVVRGTVGYSAVIAKNVRNPTKLCGCLCDQLTE